MLRKTISMLLVAILMLTTVICPALAETAEETTLTPVTLSDANVTTLGRTYYSEQGLHMNWTASGFTFTFTGTTVELELTSTASSRQPFLRLYVDGEVYGNDVAVSNRTYTRRVINGLENKKHTVKILKRTENDWNSTLIIHKMYIDGTMGTPPVRPSRLVEVIGDSITCGYGNLIGDKAPINSYSAARQDGLSTYATLAIEPYGAEMQIVSRSGIGFGCNNGGGKTDTMLDAYDCTDYFNLGEDVKWNFNAKKPDIVIIGLGTNDTANPDNKDHEDKAYQFLELVRAKNPDAYIIWAYEIMTSSRADVLMQVCNELDDGKIFYHALPMMDKEKQGDAGHPSMASHVAASVGLCELIGEITGWDTVDNSGGSDADARFESQIVPSNKTVTTFGRTYYNNNALHFNWTNSGFQFTFTGTTVSGLFTAQNSVSGGTYLLVYVDDNAPVTITLKNQSDQNVVLASGLENKTHRVRVVKRTENVWGGTASVSQLTTDGYFGTPPENRTRKIEVIGDSITCGYGNMVTAANAAGGYHSKEEDGTATYATLAASYFDADCSVIARSGIGFSCDSGGNKTLLMGDVYSYTDYLSGGGANSPLWNFAANPTDVVVLALGTNDTANADGTDYETKARAMLAQVRQLNPNAHIIWAYGMMTDSRSNVLKQIVADANADGDNKVYYLPLTHMNNIENGVGGGGHPGPATHEYNSYLLASKIAEVTGWKTVTPVEYENLEGNKVMLYDAESTSNITGVFNTGISLNSDRTQGSTSLKMTFNNAVGQANSVGGMILMSMGDGLDMSDVQTVTFDLYTDSDLIDSHGLQVNFATQSQDGFNHMVVLNNTTKGWHSFTINTKSISAVNSTADWKNIKTIRITWMNYKQQANAYMLLDNMQMVKTGSQTVELAYDSTPNPDRVAAESVTKLIDKVSVSDTASVTNARTAYDALTNTQKSMVPSIQKLVEAEAVLEQEQKDQTAAQAVQNQIEALNVQSLDDKPTVVAARETYNALTDTQKGLVTNFAKLEAAEAKIAELEQIPDVTCGDVDGDGNVSAADALEVLKSVVGKVTLTDEQTVKADVDGSGKVDAADALDILKKVVGKIDKFAVEQ